MQEEQKKPSAGSGPQPDDSPERGIDRVTLQGVRRRDRAALGRFFDATFPFVYSIAFRLTGDHTTAEDVAQDVFLKVYRAADRIDPDRSPRPWLATITANACRDVARRRTVRAEVSVDHPIADAVADGTPRADEIMARTDDERMIEGALRSLDEAHRMTVILRDYCDMSHQEIADLVGSTSTAVRKRYSRALEMMRGFLKR